VGWHDDATTIRDRPATDLSIPERVLLLCMASDTEWELAGITGATVTALIIRGLIERDAASRLALTEQGRAVLAAIGR
jgi:hypothetical protein